MRLIFNGINSITINAARRFIETGHEVVIFEMDREKVERFDEEIDCSFVIGDASRPRILQEANPRESDHLLAFSEDSQRNIVCALIGRSLGVQDVIVRIDDSDFESVCSELDLTHTLVPAEIIGKYVVDSLVHGNILDILSFLKGQVAITRIRVPEDKVPSYPSDCAPICFFRNGTFHHADEDTELRKGDELVVIGPEERGEILADWAREQKEIANGQERKD